MKVYIVMTSDGYNGNIVDRVFDTERKALDYVIKLEYSTPYYSKMMAVWLDENARLHITEHEVI
jgi:fatty acid/phospholipid biosynthesis enzyme